MIKNRMYHQKIFFTIHYQIKNKQNTSHTRQCRIKVHKTGSILPKIKKRVYVYKCSEQIASLVGAGNNVFFTNYITFETNRKK